jgi:Cytochrome bd terminal oxidase subunit I
VGKAAFLARLEGVYLATGREIYLRISTYWTKIFAVAFGMGVVTGIVMPFQFGTNWSRYSDATGGKPVTHSAHPPTWWARLRSSIPQPFSVHGMAFCPLRLSANFFNQFNLICPVQSRFQKHFCCRQTQIKTISYASRPIERGVGHRHERRGGMRWTRQH